MPSDKGQAATAGKKRPNHFYKYRSLANLDQVKDILINNRLYWSSPNQFNDPFDCAPIVTITNDPKERRAYAQRLVRGRFANAPKRVRQQIMRDVLADDLRTAEATLPEFFKTRMAGVGVCSLAEEPHNVLMWSHYADSHRGICLRLSPQVTDLDLFALPVFYSAERPIVDMAGDRDAAWAEKVLLVKADYWAYEREWRAVDVGKTGLHAFAADVLDAVYLGALISDENEALIKKWSGIRRAPTKLFKMRFDEREFRLHAHELR